MIFLGGIPKKGILFRIPGAVSHARWMAKATYAFKIYLFQDQFQVSKREKNSLRRIFIFLSRVYIRAWFLSTEAIKANTAQVMIEADKGEEKEEEKNEVNRYILHQKDFFSIYKL